MTDTQTITLYLNDKKPKQKITKSDIQLKIKDEKIVITGIPQEGRLEYLAKSRDDTYYVVYSPTKSRNYNNFKLTIGKENSFVEAKVDSVIRLRDGGTTDIAYEINGLYWNIRFPPRLKQEADPSGSMCGALEDLLKKYVRKPIKEI